VTFGDKEGHALGHGVLETTPAVAHGRDGGADLVVQVCRQVGLVLGLAARGGDGHAARQVGKKAALVEMAPGRG
jgi:hypothetical protein